MTSDQLSTSTNSMILKGRATTTGDTITMPIDMSIEATTMPMIRQGMTTLTPIWNVNSLTGTAVRNVIWTPKAGC